MANNELSGPVLLNAIMLYIKSKYKKTKYSYRFVLLPETIGSIAYLSKFRKTLKKKVICGFNLTCVGDDRSYSFVHSPKEQTLADKALEAALRGFKNVKKYSFIDRGSDERQYCSPGIDLPLCAFSRSKEYPEYHTDKDNFKVVTEKGLEGSFNVMKNIIDAFELGLYPKNVFLGEANLGKRNLYPEYSQKKTYKKNIFIRKNLLAYSDGNRSIFEISNLLGLPLDELCREYKILKLKKVLS